MVLVSEAHFRSREIVDPRNLKGSTADTVLLSMVRRGRSGGLLLKSYCHKTKSNQLRSFQVRIILGTVPIILHIKVRSHL